MYRLARPIGGVVLTGDWYAAMATGELPNHKPYHKFGKNPDIDIVSGFEDIWNGGGHYTGQDCIVAEQLETSSDAAGDAGTVLSSGIATGGGDYTIEDTGADFVADGVAIGDIVLNDTQVEEGIVIEVTAILLTVATMHNMVTNTLGDNYRIVTKASTGLPVIKLSMMLDENWEEQEEFIVLNGVSWVNTVGTYIRHARGRGKGGPQLGTITTRQATTTANITMAMPTGYNSTMICAGTIPKDCKGFILGVHAAWLARKAGNATIRVLIKHINSEWHVGDEGLLSDLIEYHKQFTIPKNDLFEMTDYKLQAEVDQNDVSIFATLDYYTEKVR